MEQQLTIEERRQFWAAVDKMEQSARKVDKIYFAIMGDEEMMQVGLLEDMKNVKAKIAEYEKEKLEIKAYVRGVLATAVVLGSVIGSVTTILIKNVLK